MNITPISGPRTAPVLGAKTVAAESARAQAVATFNAGLTTAASPSTPGAVLDPTAVATTPTLEATPTPLVEQSTAPSQADLEAKRIASHYANLARKEKALRFREAQLRQRASSTPASQQPSSSPQFDPTQYVKKEDLLNNPFGELNNLGLSYEQLTQKALDAPSAEDIQLRRDFIALQAKIKMLEDGQVEVKKNFEETQSAGRRQAELQIRQDVNRLVASDPQFEAIQAERASGEVVRLITSVYDKGMGPDYPRGTILDISDAAAMVEGELTSRALRLAKLTKIQSQLNSNNAAQKPTTNQQPAQPTLRTLTNSVGTGTRKLSARDRALAAWRGEVV